MIVGTDEAEVCQRSSTEHYVSHLAHRTVSEHSLDIGLYEGHEAAVNNGNGTQKHHNRCVRLEVRKHEARKPHESVTAGGNHDSAQQYADWCRGVCVGIGKPCVEREHTHLYQKSQKHEDDNYLECPQGCMEHGCNLEHVGGTRIEPQHEDRYQQEYCAEVGVYDVLVSRTLCILMAPEGDEQITGYQHQFPEDIELDKVGRKDNAVHRRHKKYEICIVGVQVALPFHVTDAVYAGKGAQQKDGKGDGPAEAVRIQGEVNAQRGYPCVCFQRIGAVNQH